MSGTAAAPAVSQLSYLWEYSIPGGGGMVAYSPTGDRIAFTAANTSTSSQTTTLVALDARTGQSTARRADGVTRSTLVFSPDGARLAVVELRESRWEVAVLDADDLTPVCPAPDYGDHSVPPLSLTFTRDGSTVVGCTTRSLFAVDTATGRIRWNQPSSSILGAVVSPDSRLIVTTSATPSSQAGAINLIDAGTGDRRGGANVGGPGALAFTVDSRHLVVGLSDNTIRLFPDTGSAPQWTAQLAAPDGRAGITAVAVSPDGRWIGATDWVGRLVVLNAAGGAPRFTQVQLAQPQTELLFDPTSRYLVACSQPTWSPHAPALPGGASNVVVLDASSGETVAVHADVKISSAAMSPTGTTLAVGEDTRLGLLDLTPVTPGSQYRELTSLGDVSARYPTISRLYYGRLNSDVVVIPRAYGIVRSATGLAALVQAAVDASAVSGCRFQVTFQLAPLVSNADLARLGADLSTVPEAITASLRVRFPDQLDARHPELSKLESFTLGASTVRTGADPGTVSVTVSVSDDPGGQLPAMTLANVLLNQLTATAVTLTGSVALRLDDLYPQPVDSVFVLTLGRTAGTDDIAVASAHTSATVINRSQFDLRLLDAVVTPPVEVRPLDTVLPAGGSTTVAGVGANAAVTVDAQLAVPTPLPRSRIFDYLTLQVEQVASVQHVLNFNAAIDFTGADLSRIDVTTTLLDFPGVVVASVTLLPAHRVDFVHVTVPIQAVVDSLRSEVTLTLTTTAGETRTVRIATDFLDDPILTITAATVADPR